MCLAPRGGKSWSIWVDVVLTSLGSEVPPARGHGQKREGISRHPGTAASDVSKGAREGGKEWWRKGSPGAHGRSGCCRQADHWAQGLGSLGLQTNVEPCADRPPTAGQTLL